MAEETKDLGHIKDMAINIDKPIKMDIPSMEFKSIMITVGQNGSGKSLVLKINWAVATIISTVVNAKAMGVPVDSTMIAQYVMDNTFTDQNFNGEIIANFDNGIIELVIEEGKIVRAGCEVDPMVKQVSTPIFMSTDMRTFDQIKTYFKMQEMLKSDEKMLEMYRLFDIVYVKMLEQKLKGGWNATNGFKDSINGFTGMEKYTYDSFHIEDGDVKLMDEDGEVRSLCTFSKGEQSLINMILANS